MYWYMHWCVEFEKNKNAFQMHKRLFYSTCTRTHTHTGARAHTAIYESLKPVQKTINQTQRSM